MDARQWLDTNEGRWWSRNHHVYGLHTMRPIISLINDDSGGSKWVCSAASFAKHRVQCRQWNQLEWTPDWPPEYPSASLDKSPSRLLRLMRRLRG